MPKNPVERENARWDVMYYAERYHKVKWYLGWCDSHQALWGYLQEAILGRGTSLIAVAMPRGSGKTTICRVAVEWGVLNGHVRWPLLIEAESEAFLKQMRAFRTTFRTNVMLADDYPETVWVLQKMPTSQSAPNMTCLGERMDIVYKTNEIVMPTNYLSREFGTSGGVFSGGGITSSIRGAQVTLPSGEVIRPDMVVINDMQTRESAGSVSQVAERIEILGGDVLGCGGPGRPITAVATGTVIHNGDAFDRLLSNEMPQWSSLRVKWMQDWPTNMDLWQEYGNLLRRLKIEEQPIDECNVFYESRRADMDAGAKVYWDQRIDPPYLSSVQTFMSWWILSPSSAMAEGQNEPVDPHELDTVVYCSRAEVLAKLSPYGRYEVPDDAVELVAFVDVQLDVLIYVVCAVTREYQTYIVDYGTFPDQRRDYWTKGMLSHKLSDHWTSPSEAWVEGLRVLAKQLADPLRWRRSRGEPALLSHGQVDASYGDSTDSVFSFCKNYGAGMWLPSFGDGISASRNPINHGAEAKKWQKRHRDWGWHWNRRHDNDRGCDRVLFDANAFKSHVHIGIRTPEQEPGSVQMFQGTHHLLADHIRSEFPTETQGRGRLCVEWKLRPGQDNDLLDGIAGCLVGASVRKITMPGTDGHGKKNNSPARKAFGRRNLG